MVHGNDTLRRRSAFLVRDLAKTEHFAMLLPWFPILMISISTQGSQVV